MPSIVKTVRGSICQLGLGFFVIISINVVFSIPFSELKHHFLVHEKECSLFMVLPRKISDPSNSLPQLVRLNLDMITIKMKLIHCIDNIMIISPLKEETQKI